MTCTTTPTAADDLRRGDRIDDGGSSGRIVKRVVVYAHQVRIVWIDGWSDTVPRGEMFALRERDVRLASGEAVAR
jgi:hypothetical protein